MNNPEPDQVSVAISKKTNPTPPQNPSPPQNSSTKGLFSKFTPIKINPKFAEQSLDNSWMQINGITTDREKFQFLKISIEPEIYREAVVAFKNPPDGHQ